MGSEVSDFQFEDPDLVSIISYLEHWFRCFVFQDFSFTNVKKNFLCWEAGTACTILNTMDMLNLGKKSPHVQALESLFALLRS